MRIVLQCVWLLWVSAIAFASPNPNQVPAYFLTEPIFNGKIRVLEMGDKTKPDVLLVHGLNQNGMLDWASTLDALANDYHVIALDLPGFGASDKPKGNYSPTEYAKVLHWLVSQKCSGKVTVVGHSMGGAIALRYAANFSEQVAQLVLVDAGGILQRSAFLQHLVKIPIQKKQLPNELQDWFEVAQGVTQDVVELSTQLPEVSALLKANPDVSNALLGEVPDLNAALGLVEENFTQAIRTLSIPTYIIWGDKDAITPIRTGILLRHRLANAHLYVIAGAGHMPMHTHTQAFQSHLQAILAHKVNAEALPESKPAQAELRCDHQNNQTYSGYYSRISLNNCQNVVLENVTTERLTVQDSSVSLQNITVVGQPMGLQVSRSSVQITAGFLQGDPAVSADTAQLDFAGVSLVSEQAAMEVQGASRVIFSVSDSQSPLYQGDLHGVYQGEKQTLDQQFRP